MKPIKHNSGIGRLTASLALLLLLTLAMVGCARRAAGIQIIPLSSNSVLALSTDDLIEVMRRAGFSDDQILEHGPDVYDGLAQSGAVQVRVGNRVEAVFAINRDRGDCVYISTRLRGNFIYNLQAGWLGGGR